MTGHHRGSRSLVLSAAILCALFASALAALPSAAAEEERTRRLAGADRFLTSIAVAQHAFPDGADVVYLSRSDLQVDAVAGGLLVDGPILLVDRFLLPPRQAVLDEVARLGPKRVIALGGSSAVGESVLQAMADGRPTGRLSGPDRYATAAAISAHVFPGGTHVVQLARSEAEALAMHNRRDGSVLLLPPGEAAIPETIKRELLRLGPVEVVLANYGDPAFQEIDRWSQWSASRNGWPPTIDAYSTSSPVMLATMTARFSTDHVEADRVYLGRVDDLADVVSGSILRDGPVLLTESCSVGRAVEAVLARFDPGEVVALGGRGAVCDQTLATYGLRARAPFPSPARPLRTLELGAHGEAWPVAWSGDGTTLLARPNVTVDVDSGRVRDVDWDDRYMIHEAVVDSGQEPLSISADGTKVWAFVQDGPGDEGGILEIDVATGNSTLVVPGFVLLQSGSGAVILDHSDDPMTSGPDSDLVVHDLDAGTSWRVDGGKDPYRGGVSGRPVAVAPDASWLLLADPGDDRYEPRRRLDLVRRDGTWQSIVDPIDAGNGCFEAEVLDASLSVDTRVVVYREFQGYRTDAPASCFEGPAPTVATVIKELSTGRRAELESVSRVALSGDGSTLLAAIHAEPVDEDFGPAAGPPPGRDGARLPGGTPVDGDAHLLFTVDVQDALSSSVTAVALPWDGAGPEQMDGVIGPTGDHVAWVTGWGPTSAGPLLRVLAER